MSVLIFDLFIMSNQFVYVSDLYHSRRHVKYHLTFHSASSCWCIGAPQQSGAAAGSASFPNFDFSRIPVPGASQSQQRPAPTQGRGQQQVDPYVLREMLLGNPHQMALLKQNNPPLSEALSSGDPGKITAQHTKPSIKEIFTTSLPPTVSSADNSSGLLVYLILSFLLEKFARVFNEQSEEKRKKEQEELALLTADPFDPEVSLSQHRILEVVNYCRLFFIKCYRVEIL